MLCLHCEARKAHSGCSQRLHSMQPLSSFCFSRSLCYLYCRCSKSVSIVIPAYYAHLAAARGKAMITHGASASDTESTMSGQSGQAVVRSCFSAPFSETNFKALRAGCQSPGDYMMKEVSACKLQP